MDILSIALIALRGAALAATVSGQTRVGDQLYKLGDLFAAGLATDAHMKEVAGKLQSRNAIDADFSDVLQRIEAGRGKLHSDNRPTG